MIHYSIFGKFFEFLNNFRSYFYLKQPCFLLNFRKNILVFKFLCFLKSLLSQSGFLSWKEKDISLP
ncbi:hypothetical protein RIEPE_0119 [Candidatus Riesia pediculicola USDA]|uniref:Uncharacterized protein n=1 Tax=Riesia pediculicola (strain USDA) TaxID=515618 RepID=D4G7T0_RIEPU|nr:hypothetical protein RIEPE_0119 [Candidatus Riesia pediculicola USDA]ARC53649.1 hypothetical protein AOE55_00555 [Candidatus Riesia pediculicola]